MDEAEKYKQRLEAIAEKRRLLEEQERAKREMEDERIRLQQLKRKSLRDQWLMEGPPLSPTSLDAPRSPLWGTQAQDIDKHIDKLESQTQRLAEAEEHLREVMEDGQNETVIVEETEMTPDLVLNGTNAAELGEEIPTESPHVDKVTLTNGTGDMDEDTSLIAKVDSPPIINGQTEETKSVRVVDLDDDVADVEEEEDDTMVIRAECIMIVDESDEIGEENTKENGFDENVVTPIQEETEKTVPESAPSEGTVASAEAELPEKELTPSSVEEEALEDETAQLESQTEEDAVVASVPVYTEAEPCVTTTPQVEVQNGDTNEDETIEVAPKAKGNVTVEFQEVPLSEPRHKQAPGEQEPLLSRIKAKDPERARPRNQVETPHRAEQAETKMPKRKTCQCCSVM